MTTVEALLLARGFNLASFDLAEVWKEQAQLVHVSRGFSKPLLVSPMFASWHISLTSDHRTSGSLQRIVIPPSSLSARIARSPTAIANLL